MANWVKSLTGSSHNAATEELGTEDSSDVSSFSVRRQACCQHPWVTSTDEELQPTVRGKEAAPGGENISSQCALSERSTFRAHVVELYL